ncbi:hypothetical protein DAEQUDRAFT_36379 [Daedalea quercina L-15889]|uniref:Uncharacterized protein n=1 Tax=Daedalea quercina L-15889 TaxID=1314783 RepID=A0A165ST67_9APHY|nr:hypothetical protein DAEQUDRAFT_36379 [Daedalea quercina L-15889]
MAAAVCAQLVEASCASIPGFPCSCGASVFEPRCFSVRSIGARCGIEAMLRGQGAALVSKADVMVEWTADVAPQLVVGRGPLAPSHSQ